MLWKGTKERRMKDEGTDRTGCDATTVARKRVRSRHLPQNKLASKLETNLQRPFRKRVFLTKQDCFSIKYWEVWINKREMSISSERWTYQYLARSIITSIILWVKETLQEKKKFKTTGSPQQKAEEAETPNYGWDKACSSAQGQTSREIPWTTLKCPVRLQSYLTNTSQWKAVWIWRMWCYMKLFILNLLILL